MPIFITHIDWVIQEAEKKKTTKSIKQIDSINSIDTDLKTYIDGKFSLVMKDLTKIKLNLNEIYHNLHLTGKDGTESKYDNISKYIPLVSKEKAEEFDALITADPKLEIEMVTFVRRVGGTSYKEVTVRALKRVFENEFAQYCSWLGQRNNYRVKNLRVISIIKDVVSKLFPITDKDYEMCASEWFRQAKQRAVREQKKALS